MKCQEAIVPKHFPNSKITEIIGQGNFIFDPIHAEQSARTR